MTERPLSQRIAYGAKAGALLGVAYACIATVAFVIRGPNAFFAMHAALPTLYAAYLLGGSLSGMILALLAPLGRTLLGALIVGSLSVAPLVLGARVVLRGFAPWDRADSVVITASSVLIGGLAGVLIQRELGSLEL